MNTKPIRILVVDDDPMVRRILTGILNEGPDMEVVAGAPDPFVARDKIVELAPDVLTLDVEMPRMNGVDFLRKLMPQYPLPVVMVSSLTEAGKVITLEALEAGAIDFVTKPDGTPASLNRLRTQLVQKVRTAAGTDVSDWRGRLDRKAVPTPRPPALKRSRIKVVGIGASTGGTTAIQQIISGLPANMPGIVVVQHMPEEFTRLYANRLNAVIPDLEIKEAENGDMIVPGRVLIAPGNRHMAVRNYGNEYRVNLFDYEKVQGHRPSVDVLFSSIAETVLPDQAIGVILTGMGKDGAQGLQKMHAAGMTTLGQDERSSIVYGMPGVAMQLGAVQKQLPLDAVASEIIQIIKS